MSRIRGPRRILAGLALLVVIPVGGWAAWVPAPDAQDMANASVVAQQGLVDAEARLKAYFPFRAFPGAGQSEPYKFWGPDKTETQDPLPTDTVQDATNPSFAVEADGDPDTGSPAPRTMVIEGAERGISGTGTGTYALNGDHYALKVSDLSGRLYVNDGLDQGGTGSVSQNLQRILNILGTIVSVPNLGTQILQNRPVAGYQTDAELLAAVGNDAAAYSRFREFVTLHAWVDPNVANPVPLSATMASQYPVSYYRGSPPVYRMGSSKDVSGAEIAPPGGYMTCPTACSTLPHSNPAILLYGLDTLNPQWIEIVSRAPVNVNTARREVLVSLISGLKGFFVADRRRNNPRWKGDLLLSFKMQNSFSPVGTEGDEVGFLTETVWIGGPGGGPAGSVSAYDIADEIIACRNRAASAYHNYSQNVWWHGPFKTWRQWNAFVDNLVAVSLLADNRPYHFDYEPETDDPTGYGLLVPSAMQQAQASRALGDVLKANFNPNLHLNELNPDHNLHTLVDKTDLIINSTEFCFIPTGVFQVESVGRVVRPVGGGADAFGAPDNELMAETTATAVLQLYDLYRETNQFQFRGGQVSAVSGVPDTNSGLSLEIGPEPENGVFPGNGGAGGNPDNEWSGYVALPTVGGVWHSSPLKTPNTLVKTQDLAAGPHLGSAFHVHYTLDSDAHDHPLNPVEIAGGTVGVDLPDEEVSNHPDRNLSYSGPYDPTDGPGGSIHRLARSFRRPGGSSPTLTPQVPSDLRIDGIYSERHAAPAYYLHTSAASIWDFNSVNASGMVSFWFKPSFYPELTGKIRKPWDMTRYHRPCASNIHVWPFEMLFYPCHYNTAISEFNQPRFWANNMGQFHPTSFTWGSVRVHGDEDFPIDAGHQSHAFGKVTRSLNHIGHADEGINPTTLRAHRWINTTFQWDLLGMSTANPWQMSALYFNGVTNDVLYSYTSMTGWNERYDKMWGFSAHSGGAYNHMRFGGPSRIADAAAIASPPGLPGAYRGNHAADFTIDEAYVWQTAADADPRLLWNRGRYAVTDQTYGEGEFTSRPISLPPAAEPGPPPVTVLGIAWTWYGEESRGLAETPEAPYLYDYQSGTPTDIQPKTRVSELLDGVLAYPTEIPPLGTLNDGFAATRQPGGAPVVIQDSSQLRYRVKFEMNAAFGTILLGTPVLDDVTIYWNDGRSNSRLSSQTPVTITGPASIPDGDVGTVYPGVTFTASGGGTPTWATSGSFPPGLTLDSATGVLFGTPAGGGTFTFTVTVTTSGGSGSTQFTMVVTGPPLATGGGGGGGGGCGSCGTLGAEVLLFWLLLRAFARRSRRKR